VWVSIFVDFFSILLTYLFQAKYAYRSIAEFVKHVTTHDAEHLERNPFPELHRPLSKMPVDENSTTGRHEDISAETEATREREQDQKLDEVVSPSSNPVRTHSQLPSDVNLFLKAEKVTSNEVIDHDVDMKPSGSGSSSSKEPPADPDSCESTKVSPTVFRPRKKCAYIGQPDIGYG
jgi:hypothetical protein